MHAPQWAVFMFLLGALCPEFHYEWKHTRGGKWVTWTISTPPDTTFIGLGLVFLTLALT